MGERLERLIALARRSAALACSRMTDRHTFSSIAEKLHSVHSSFRIALKVMTTITDGAFNLVCLHDNGDTVYAYYIFAGLPI